MTGIDNQFKIIQKILDIAFLIQKQVKPASKQFGLTEMEAQFLVFLGIQKKEIPIRQFVCFFHKHKSTVRQKLKPLEKKGFIKLSIPDDDKREKRVSLTKKGREVFQKIAKEKRRYRSVLFQNFSEDDFTQLLQLLEKLQFNDNIHYEKCI